MLYLFFFFFFQAEDGIRDLYVTEVQTCALPISAFVLAREKDKQPAGDGVVDCVQQGGDLDGLSEPEEDPRAEERHDAVRRGVRGKLRAHLVHEVREERGERGGKQLRFLEVG